jgi:hypothetical protein
MMIEMMQQPEKMMHAPSPTNTNSERVPVMKNQII